MSKKLSSKDAYKFCDPKIFKVETTKDIKPFPSIIGQERVIQSLGLASRIPNSGYNIFAVGPSGIGKKRFIKNFLEQKKILGEPKDYCYVHNFDEAEKPIYLEFSAGKAKEFKADMDKLVSDLKIMIPAALETESYKNKINRLNLQYVKKQESQIIKIKNEAEKNKVSIAKTPQGFMIIAVNDKNEPLSKEEIDKLTESEKKLLETTIKAAQEKLEDIVEDFPKLEKEKIEKTEQLTYQATTKVALPQINKVTKEWSLNDKITNYLNKVKDTILNNSGYFIESPAPEKPNLASLLSGMPSSSDTKNLNMFEVNVITDNSNYISSENSKTPITILDDPTTHNLFGKIDNISQFGSVFTNFTLIKSGALHTINYGYIIINARKVLEVPMLWNQLKKLIKSSYIQVNQENYLSLAVSSLEPEPIPFKGKIVLIGEPDIYSALWHYDPEFKELFKVTADFDTEIDANTDNIVLYSEIISSLIEKENLIPLDKTALAKIIEIGSRAVEDQNKITANISFISDVIREANYLANNDKKTIIDGNYIDTAFKLKRERHSKIPNYMKKQIMDSTILIETGGEQIGQINGLAVYRINEFTFGQPQRISCSVYRGQKDVIDIERNVNLAGAIYSKGVMILSAYLHSLFSQDELLSFSGFLNFEQSYGMVEGDSATAAETFALISALSGIPIKQNFATTGSMDQKGRVQAIGGINDKIEGFFAICKQRGLNGNHSIIMPMANIKNLMLSSEICEALDKGLFHIYAISHINEGIELLTGMQMGEKDKKTNKFPEGTLGGIIQSRWIKTPVKIEPKK